MAYRGSNVKSMTYSGIEKATLSKTTNCGKNTPAVTIKA
jgi:hypothetical protein